MKAHQYEKASAETRDEGDRGNGVKPARGEKVEQNTCALAEVKVRATLPFGNCHPLRLEILMPDAEIDYLAAKSGVTAFFGPMSGLMDLTQS